MPMQKKKKKSFEDTPEQSIVTSHSYTSEIQHSTTMMLPQPAYLDVLLHGHIIFSKKKNK